MLRNWKQVCLLSNFLKFGNFYLTARCSEIRKYGQTLHKRTSVSLCGSCRQQFKKFCIPSTETESALKCSTRRHLHKSVSVKSNYSKEVKPDHSTDIKLDWTVHEKLITTCIGLWEDYPEGSNFIVSYIDTASQLTKIEKNQMPTVLAVARDVGHSDSLKPLIESLACSGFRVIMPYLVGSELTRGLTLLDEERFSNMLGERSAFLLDFIGSVGVQRFDVAIGHSLECFPILTLASYFHIFNNVVFICPIPGHVSPRWIRPLKISLTMLDLFKSSIFWPFAMLYFHTYVRQKVSTYRHATAKELHLAVEISHGINYDTVAGFVTMFESHQIPILYIYCDADPMVDSKLSREFAEIFGITSGMTDSYGADGQLIEKATGLSSSRYFKALRFSTQTHFPHSEKHFRDIIVKELTELYSNTSTKRARKTPAEGPPKKVFPLEIFRQ